MTEIEKLKRWADKQGWLLLGLTTRTSDSIAFVRFLMPCGKTVKVCYSLPSGDVAWAQDA